MTVRSNGTTFFLPAAMQLARGEDFARGTRCDSTDYRAMLACSRASAIAPPFVRVHIEARDGVSPVEAAAAIIEQQEREEAWEWREAAEANRRAEGAWEDAGCAP